MMLTQENAHEYEGKRLDAERRAFHYYPMLVVRQKSGFHVIDRCGTMMRVPDEKDGGIWFDKEVRTE